MKASSCKGWVLRLFNFDLYFLLLLLLLCFVPLYKSFGSISKEKKNTASRNFHFSQYWPKLCQNKKESCEPWKLATVLRIICSNRGSSGSVLLLYRRILRVKRTGMMRGSRLTGSDDTVWSDPNLKTILNLSRLNKWCIG